MTGVQTCALPISTLPLPPSHALAVARAVRARRRPRVVTAPAVPVVARADGQTGRAPPRANVAADVGLGPLVSGSGLATGPVKIDRPLISGNSIKGRN